MLRSEPVHRNVLEFIKLTTSGEAFLAIAARRTQNVIVLAADPGFFQGDSEMRRTDPGGRREEIPVSKQDACS